MQPEIALHAAVTTGHLDECKILCFLLSVAFQVLFMYNESMKRTELETRSSDMVTIPRAEYDAIREENERLRNLYDQLLEKFVLAQRNRFGSKAEPASDEVMEQLSFSLA